MPRMSDEQLTVSEVAARLGLAVSTVQTYRRDGRLPSPDGYLGRTPWWRPATIDVWQAARPGRGRAGIPRKSKRAPAGGQPGGGGGHDTSEAEHSV